MQCGNIPSEITGRGLPVPECPGTDAGKSASYVRYETKDEQQEMPPVSAEQRP
jgi:hypothetical protein